MLIREDTYRNAVLGTLAKNNDTPSNTRETNQTKIILQKFQNFYYHPTEGQDLHVKSKEDDSLIK